MKVGIGLVLTHGFPIPVPFIKGVFDWYGALISGMGNAAFGDGEGIQHAQLIYSEDFPIDAARNDICRVFLDQYDGDYLVFLDADMRHPRDVVHRLVSHGAPIVTGRYQMRRPPFHTVAMRKTGPGARDYKAIEEQSGVVPIDAAGAGVLAIRRDVLERLRVVHGDEWFAYSMGPNNLRSVSEDMTFFERAKALGIQALCDLDIKCSHVASFEVGAEWHQPFKEAYDAKTNVAVPV